MSRPVEWAAFLYLCFLLICYNTIHLLLKNKNMRLKHPAVKNLLFLLFLSSTPMFIYAQSNQNAATIFKKYIAAMGGEKGFRSIKDMVITGSSEIQGMALTITETKKAPDKWMQLIEMTRGEQKATVQRQVYNGTTGYQELQEKKVPVTGDDLEEFKESADIAMDLHPEKYGIKRTLKGMEDVNGSKAYVIDVVAAKNKKSEEYYDATTYLLVKKIQGNGKKLQTTEYSDYRDVPGAEGYKMPYKVTESEPGSPSITEIVTNVEINKGIDDSVFN